MPWRLVNSWRLGHHVVDIHAAAAASAANQGRGAPLSRWLAHPRVHLHDDAWSAGIGSGWSDCTAASGSTCCVATARIPAATSRRRASRSYEHPDGDHRAHGGDVWGTSNCALSRSRACDGRHAPAPRIGRRGRLDQPLSRPEAYQAVCPQPWRPWSISPTASTSNRLLGRPRRPENLDAAIVAASILAVPAVALIGTRESTFSCVRWPPVSTPNRPACSSSVAGDGAGSSGFGKPDCTSSSLSNRACASSGVRCTARRRRTYLQQRIWASVVPSRNWESFGLVVLEAYAAGCPVIASDLPGLGDLIEEGKTGATACSTGIANSIGPVLQMLLDNPAATQAMGAQARRVVKQYAWQEIARRHLLLYETVLAGCAARASA